MRLIETIFNLHAGDLNKVIFSLLTNLILALIIIILGFWFTRFLTNLVDRILRKSEIDPGLNSFLRSFLSLALKIMVVISAITQLGVEMTSFLTLLGAAGIAIGMAFSGTLSNFAGGIMILVLKPFKVGDDIFALGQQGVVSEIQIFNTYLKTADHKILIHPNGPLANGTIINFTKEKQRRIEWNFVFEQDVSISEIRNSVLVNLAQDKRILQNPAPTVVVQRITEIGLHITVRCWVLTKDYSHVFFECQQSLIEALHVTGIPFAKA
jgi:small conductance mechanosensitive channel